MSNQWPVQGTTILTGTVADPVAHIQAPESMGRWFAGHGIDAVWLPFHVHPRELPKFMDGVRSLENMAGLTVTIPHKHAIVSLADEISEYVRRTGVANMIRREHDGRLVADNADGSGFVSGLKASNVEMSTKSIWLVGAGGAGTAIAWSLAEQGPARLAIRDLDMTAAERLVDELKTAYPRIEFAAQDPRPEDIDIAINATPSGLRPEDPLPFDPSVLRKDACVVEIIMKPALTALLRRASACGLKTVPGQRMLDGQLQIYAEYLGLFPSGSQTGQISQLAEV